MNVNLTLAQLREAVEIGTQIEALQARLQSVMGGQTGGLVGTLVPTTNADGSTSKGKMSAAGRAKIAAGQRERWAKKHAADAAAEAAAQKAAGIAPVAPVTEPVTAPVAVAA